jgi:hypothetical protein
MPVVAATVVMVVWFKRQLQVLAPLSFRLPAHSPMAAMADSSELAAPVVTLQMESAVWAVMEELRPATAVTAAQ